MAAVDQLRKLHQREDGPTGQFRLNGMDRGKGTLAGRIVEAWKAGELSFLDTPARSRGFDTQSLYFWLSGNALHDMPGPEMFIAGLDHKKSGVRIASSRALTARWPKEGRAAALARLSAKPAGTRGAAVALLHELRATDCVPRFQQMLEKERAVGVKKALTAALRELGAVAAADARMGDVPAPRPSRFPPRTALSDDSVRKQLKWYCSQRIGVLLPTEQLAEAVGLEPAQAEAEMLALQKKEEKNPSQPLRWFRAHGVGWIYQSLSEVWKKLRAPRPEQIEQLMQAGAWERLDGVLASCRQPPPKGLEGAPPLRYRDGSDASPEARDWLLFQIYRGRESGAHLVRAAFDDDSCGQLAIWLSQQKARPRKDLEFIQLLADDAYVNHVGARFADREINVSHMAGWGRPRSAPVARWAFRFWRTIPAWTIRQGFYGAIGRWPERRALEQALPEGRDPSGGVMEWRQWVVEGLEHAMASEHAWPLAEFEAHYLERALPRRACRGVVFEIGMAHSGQFVSLTGPVVVGNREDGGAAAWDWIDAVGEPALDTAGAASADPKVLAGLARLLESGSSGAAQALQIVEALPDLDRRAAIAACRAQLHVRVAHPARGNLASWPDAGRALFPQRLRTAVGPEPDVTKLPAIPGREWTRRLAEAWFENGASDSATNYSKVHYDTKDYGPLELRLHHSGYQYDAPVQLKRMELKIARRTVGWAQLSPVQKSEILRDLSYLTHEESTSTQAAPAAPAAPVRRGSGPSREKLESSGLLAAVKMEQAKSGRAKCRHCKQKIEKGDWRLGEPYRIPRSTSGRIGHRWWHLECALAEAPEMLLAGIEQTPGFTDADAWKKKISGA